MPRRWKWLSFKKNKEHATNTLFFFFFLITVSCFLKMLLESDRRIILFMHFLLYFLLWGRNRPGFRSRGGSHDRELQLQFGNGFRIWWPNDLGSLGRVNGWACVYVWGDPNWTNLLTSLMSATVVLHGGRGQAEVDRRWVYASWWLTRCRNQDKES